MAGNSVDMASAVFDIVDISVIVRKKIENLVSEMQDSSYFGDKSKLRTIIRPTLYDYILFSQSTKDDH